jgi:hypothetical protein
MFNETPYIEWKVGDQYRIDDIMEHFIGTLEGFIVNQIPVNWKDQSSHRNHSDHTIYLVFKYEKQGFMSSGGYVIAVPNIKSYFPSSDCDREGWSRITLYGIEYGDSIDQLIRKLQENRVFTKKINFDAIYKEGYKEKND